MAQRYDNHVRYYPLHHFIFYPAGMLLLAFTIRGAILHSADRWEWIALSAAVFGILLLSFMVRQHYALTCQNRIVRLEMRFRYFALTQQRLEPLEQQLSFGQLAALRFAADDELPPLVQRAIHEQLSSDAIKKSIKNWQPDLMRV